MGSCGWAELLSLDIRTQIITSRFQPCARSALSDSNSQQAMITSDCEESRVSERELSREISRAFLEPSKQMEVTKQKQMLNPRQSYLEYL